MKIFSWMQSKLSGSQRFSKPNTFPPKNNGLHETSKEEFSDWPSGFLTIGTFGSNALKNPDKTNVSGDIIIGHSDQDRPEEITDEEVKQLQKELKLFTNIDSDFTEESPKHTLPAEKFFEFLKTLEEEETSTSEERSQCQESSTAVYSKGNDDQFIKKKNICKKSFTFLLKKVFHRTANFKLNPQFGDPVRELKLEKSRLEKILRAMLKKKVYPQNNGPQGPVNKILDQKHLSDSDSDDEESKDRSKGSKWVKTDSDYIVLEI